LKNLKDEDQRGPESPEHTRWNFFWLVTESSAFQIGMAWVNMVAVLPLFIGRLTPSTVLIGLTMVLMRLGWVIPQLPIALVVGHRPQRAPYLRWGVFFGRLPFLAFLVYLWLAELDSPSTVLWLLMVSYAFIALGNGVVAVPLQDITAKSIPPRTRGRFFGSIMLVTALTTFAVGYVVRWLLGPAGPGFPRDYTALFTLMAAFLSLSTLGCGMAREPVRPVLDRPETLRGLAKAGVQLLTHRREFRSLVVVATLGVGLSLSAPFYMVYATKELGVRDAMAGVYIWAAVLGTAFASMMWAHLNDRHGPLTVLRGGSVLVTTAPLLALGIPLVAVLLSAAEAGNSPLLAYGFSIVFLACGSTMGAFRMGLSNYLFELASDEERPRYIAVMNTLAMPGALLPLLVGWLLNHLSFQAVFVCIAAAGALSVAVSLRMPHRRS
jgi:MFS family permease